jgi:hypothetical protein
VTPVADLSVSFFRAENGFADIRPTVWRRLARGGVDVRPIKVDGITHNSMMRTDHAGLVAAELGRAIDESLAGSLASDQQSSRRSA